MRNKRLKRRLLRVAKNMLLLEKLALSEGQFIQRASQRSVEVMKKSLDKVEAAANSLADPRVVAKLMTIIHRVVSPVGVVHQSMFGNENSDAIKSIRATKDMIPPLTAVVARLMASSLYASRLQNADLTDLAQVDPRYTEQFMRAQEKLSENLSIMDEVLSKVDLNKKVPTENRDSTSLEAVENQIREAERDMRSRVLQVSDSLQEKAKTLFPDDEDLNDALDQNIIAAMPDGRRVNTELFKNKEFYSDVLELQRGQSYDLGEFLGTRKKKIIYQAYRSLIMAIRALGVAQWALSRPDLVLSNPKARDFLMNAQRILKKRTSLVLNKLASLPDEEDEDDVEAPKGTFSDVFEEEKEAPKGTFSNK